VINCESQAEVEEMMRKIDIPTLKLAYEGR